MDQLKPSAAIVAAYEGSPMAAVFYREQRVVTEGSLNEFHMIVARGLLRRFDRTLQFRSHTLFLNSLVRLGFLCLGSGETMRMTHHENVLRRFDDEATIYRRMR